MNKTSIITFIEARGHEAYRLVTAPIEKELNRRGYNTETIYPAEGQNPSPGSIAIFTNYFWALYKLKEHYDIKIPVIYMTHGLSPWKYLNKGYQDCDFILLTTEFERGKIFPIKEGFPNNDHIFVTGWAKHDLLAEKIKNKNKIKQEVIKKLNLEKGKPIISYLPTFTHRTKDYYLKNLTLKI